MTSRPGNNSAQTSKGFSIGWLADLEWLAQNPDRLEQLHTRMGIDIVWLESGTFHTAGFHLSEEAWSASPFRDWGQRPGLSRHRQVRHLPDEAFPVLPGVLAGADDADLRGILEVAHRLGIEVWGHMGLWSYGSMVYPELAVQDIWDTPIAPEEDRWGACFCPSKPQLNSWLTDCLCEVVQRYPIDGLEVDHARYAPPPSIPNLFTCACPECQQQAIAWGIDLRELASTLSAGLGRMKAASVTAVEVAMEKASTPQEVLDSFVSDSAASRWFEVRARHVSTVLGEMARSTHQAARRPFAFGIDVFPPSVAVLGGHVYEALSDLDYFTGGFGTIGWDSVGLSTCREWASFLCDHWPGLDEGRVLHNLYRMFRYEGLALPEEIGRLDRPDCAMRARVVVREIERMARCRPSGMLIYPPISMPSYDEPGLRRVCQTVVEQGLDGMMIAGLEHASARQERIITESLPR